MQRIHLTIALDAEATTAEQRIGPFASQVWAPAAQGRLRADLANLDDGTIVRQDLYLCPLTLREEDHSRRAIVSLRYTYVLDGVRLQIAKAYLLHYVGRLQREGWQTSGLARAIERDILVDDANVTTRLCWAVQVQYVGGRTTRPPTAGTYSTVVVSQLLTKKLTIGYSAPYRRLS
jgi:hypothetical protein